MKKFFLFAAAALLAACSGDELTVKEQPQVQAEPGAVTFEAYTQRATTRAGYAYADITNSTLQSQGFGVFGYYTDNRDYDQLATPNFMYNTKVSTAAWTYEPVMYWPNEYGDNAISDDNDKVTFFAYAPYVKVVPTTGKLDAASITAGKDKWGITEMTRNTAAGDPIVKYIASFKSAESVDLCWGLCQQSDWALVQGGNAQTFDLGKPWINVERPAGVNQKLKFQFMHATAKMKIQINEFNDAYTATTNVDSKTRIWIRSVRFTGFTMKGALNLNNETKNTPYWMNYNGIGDLVADGDVIVYDGRKDGKEAVGEATNEKSKGLNAQFIEDNLVYDYSASPTTWQTKTGVTATLQNLFEDSGNFYVIPTGDPMQIEIVYDVETIDPNLGTVLADGKTKGSHIENRITKNIEFGNGINKLEYGKAYDIRLHLGMNSVKFDASVVDWENMASPDIDLPSNMPAYNKNAALGTIEIPGTATEFYFAVTGLSGGESFLPTTGNTSILPSTSTTKVEVSSTGSFTSPDGRANASGVAYIKVSGFNVNDNITNLTTTDAVTITGAMSGVMKLQVVQKAQPLALVAPAVVSGSDWTLMSQRASAVELSTVLGTVATTPAYSAIAKETDKIKVWVDGTLLNIIEGSGTPTKAQVLVDWSNGKLSFTETLDASQTVKVYIEAGDVPGETISFKGDGSAL